MQRTCGIFCRRTDCSNKRQKRRINTLTAGIKGHLELTVTEDKLASKVGSGLVNVFATPMMIAAIEQTAAESVQKELQEGCTTVGTLVNFISERFCQGARKRNAVVLDRSFRIEHFSRDSVLGNSRTSELI